MDFWPKNFKLIQYNELDSTNSEMENVVEDSSVNEMEKSFTQEALEPIQSETVEEEASNDLKEFLSYFFENKNET